MLEAESLPSISLPAVGPPTIAPPPTTGQAPVEPEQAAVEPAARRRSALKRGGTCIQFEHGNQAGFGAEHPYASKRAAIGVSLPDRQPDTLLDTHQEPPASVSKATSQATAAPKEKAKAEPKKKPHKTPEEIQQQRQMKAAEDNMTKMLANLSAALSRASEIESAVANSEDWKYLQPTPMFAQLLTEKKALEAMKQAYPLVKSLMVSGTDFGHQLALPIRDHIWFICDSPMQM